MADHAAETAEAEGALARAGVPHLRSQWLKALRRATIRFPGREQSFVLLSIRHIAEAWMHILTHCLGMARSLVCRSRQEFSSLKADITLQACYGDGEAGRKHVLMFCTCGCHL